MHTMLSGWASQMPPPFRVDHWSGNVWHFDTFLQQSHFKVKVSWKILVLFFCESVSYLALMLTLWLQKRKIKEKSNVHNNIVSCQNFKVLKQKDQHDSQANNIARRNSAIAASTFCLITVFFWILEKMHTCTHTHLPIVRDFFLFPVNVKVHVIFYFSYMHLNIAYTFEEYANWF